jgi:hypothetical protein
MFVKAMLTLPALALSFLVVYSSWPSRLASSFSELLPVAAEDEGVLLVVLAVLVVAGGLVVAGAVVLEEALLLEELPQPASRIRPSPIAAAATTRIERAFARA